MGKGRGMEGESEGKLLQHTGWAEGTLQEELDKKQGEFAGLLTREDALALLSQEKGIEAPARQEKAAVPLGEVKPGEQQVNAKARAWHVFATKHFSKKTPYGERSGKVRNILLKDATGEAMLVLWGKDAEWPDAVGLHRNSIIELFGAASKLGAKGMELHSSLTTRLTLSKQDQTTLPTHPAKAISPSEIISEKQDVDIKGTIAKIGRKSEFTRVKKTGETEKGRVFDCWLEAQGKQVRLVAWDGSALQLEGVASGDSVTLEGASVRKPKEGTGFEVHAGWASHILIEKGAGTANTAAASLQAQPIAISKIGEAGEGAQVLIDASVKSVSNAWSLLKCASCGGKTPLKAGAETSCSCGGKYSKLFVVRALLEDSTGGVETVFFNEQALSLLGLNSIPLDGSAIIDLKKDEATGKALRVQLKLKKSRYSGEIEGTASSIAPQPAQAATLPIQTA